MKTLLKIGSLAQIFVAATIMQTAQAENLFTVYLHAKEADPQIRLAEANYLATIEKGSQALADFKPKVTLTSSARYAAAYNWTEFDNSSASALSANYTLSLTQPLYRPEINERIKQSNIFIAQAEEALFAEQQNLILRVVEAYFGYLQARDAAELARAEADAIARQSQRIIAYFEAGRSTITEIQESRARNAEAKSSIVGADQNVEIALEKLYILTGRDYKVLSGTTEQTPLVLPQPNDMSAWIDEAFNYNQKVIAALFDAELAHKSVDIITASKKPVLDFFANNGANIAQAKAGADSQSVDTSVGIQFSMNLFDSGKTDSQIREAWNNVDKATLQVEVQRRSAVESTSTYFLNIQTGLNQIDALRKSYTASQTAARATQEGFKAGTRTVVDVILSVRETFRVERNYIAANYDFLLNTIRLKQAAGILSETDLQLISNIMNRPRSVRLSALKRF